MNMTQDEKQAPLPSYEDSVNGSLHSFPNHSHSRGQQILDNLTLVRTRHLQTVINESVIPIVERQALNGIAQSTIAMIPSDVPLPAPASEKSEFSFENDEKDVEVIGFSSDEEPHIVRLEGQINRTEFWRAQVIVKELERMLLESLSGSPHIRSATQDQPTSPEASGKQPRKGLFSRIAKKIHQEEADRSEVPVSGETQSANGSVLVKARSEELCLRTANEFGLYDTMTKQCVIIRIQAGI